MAEHRQLCPKLLSLLKVWLKLGGEEKERIEEAPSGDRTHDRTLTKRMLYQLSYRGCTIHWLVLQSAVEKLVGMPASGLKQTSPRKVRRTRKALCLQEGWRRNGFRLLRRRAKSKNPATRNRTRDHLIAAALYSQMLYQLSYSRRCTHITTCFLHPSSGV